MKQWASATVPAPVISGGNSEPFFHNTARVVASVLPDAEYRVLEGQARAVAPQALAPVPVEFFATRVELRRELCLKVNLRLLRSEPCFNRLNHKRRAQVLLQSSHPEEEQWHRHSQPISCRRRD